MRSVRFLESITPSYLDCRTHCYQKYLAMQIDVMITATITCHFRPLCYTLFQPISFTKKTALLNYIIHLQPQQNNLFWQESINQLIIRLCNTVCFIWSCQEKRLRNFYVNPTFGCLYEVYGWRIWEWGHLDGQIFEAMLWDWCLSHHSHLPPWLSHNCCCASADMGSPRPSRFPGNHPAHPEAPRYKEHRDFNKVWFTLLQTEVQGSMTLVKHEAIGSQVAQQKSICPYIANSKPNDAIASCGQELKRVKLTCAWGGVTSQPLVC